MISKPLLTVILPAYREAENLRGLLPGLQETLGALGASTEILVIDATDSIDDTAVVCTQFGARHINRAGGDLYGHAIRTGIAQSQGKHVVIMDADGSHDPAFVKNLWDRRQEADLIIASRYMKGGHTENVAVLVLMSLIVNVVFRIVLNLKCADVSNSFRLYPGEELRSLELECNHFDIVEEILVKLAFGRPGFTILEIPCVFYQRKAGHTKRKLLLFAFGYIFTLIRLFRLKLQASKSKPWQSQ